MNEMTKKTRGADATKTRAKIIKAARKLFMANGFNGSSMREIAKQAKVTQSLLHHHFGNKEQLWQKVKAEMMDQYFNDIERRVEQGDQNDVRRTLPHALENRFRFMQNNPDIVRMALWQHLDNCKTRSVSKGHDLLRKLIANIDKAQQTKKIRDDISPAMLVVITFILSTGWFQQDYQWILSLAENEPTADDKKAEAEAYLSAIQKILIDGILK